MLLNGPRGSRVAQRRGNSIITPGSCRPKTCIPDEQLVSGYIHVAGYNLLVWDTCRLYLDNIITIHSVDLYPFVSSNRRATNWRQFCCRYKKHVDGNKWIQVDTTCVRQLYPGVNAALDTYGRCVQRTRHTIVEL